MVSYLQLSEIYGIPETDDPREKWAIYCAQCMVAVVERYHRHQRAQPWREAMQLVRILHAYNGSGPSRRIISNLQRAMREGTATPEVFRTGRLLMDTLTEVLAAHRPREQPLLALFVQFRETISRTPPFNGEISDPSKVFLNWERTLIGQSRAPEPAPAGHQPWQRSGWTQMSFTPMRYDDTEGMMTPPRTGSTNTSQPLATSDLQPGMQTSAQSLSALREASFGRVTRKHQLNFFPSRFVREPISSRMVKTRSSSAGQADAEGMPAQTRTPPLPLMRRHQWAKA